MKNGQMEKYGLDWTGLDWTGLWTGLDWTVLIFLSCFSFFSKGGGGGGGHFYFCFGIIAPRTEIVNF